MHCYFHEDISMDSSGISVSLLHNPSFYVPAHWHSALELLYLAQGTGKIRISRRDYPLPAGAISLVNSMEVHESWSHGGNECLCVHIDPNRMNELMPGFDRLYLDLRLGTDCQREELLSILQTLTQQCRQGEQTERFAQLSLLYHLLDLLVQHFSAPRLHAAPQEITRLEPLLVYVEQHHNEPISVAQAAELLGFHPSYFCRFFKQQMGTTFLHYLNTVRLSHIDRDLLRSDQSIGQLAEAHGFTNLKLFHKMFRALYDCTPRERRQMLHTDQLAFEQNRAPKREDSTAVRLPNQKG